MLWVWSGVEGFSGHEAVIKGTIQEVMFLFDVLKHTALLQVLPIENGLTRVLGQAHLLKPLNKVTAKKAFSDGGLPTPDIQTKVWHEFSCLKNKLWLLKEFSRFLNIAILGWTVNWIPINSMWVLQFFYLLFLTMSWWHLSLWYLINWEQVSLISSGKSAQVRLCFFLPFQSLHNLKSHNNTSGILTAACVFTQNSCSWVRNKHPTVF